MQVYRAFVQGLYEQLRVTGSLEASLQTSQTDTKLPGKSGKLSTQSASSSYCGILALGAYCKAMQELTGTTQMTLLIILFGLSAYVFL
jgi:hypothetical protein